MPDGKTVKEILTEEKSKIAGMTVKQKWSYFKTYYLWIVLVLLGLLVVACWMGIEMRLSMRDEVAAGVFINVEANQDFYDYLTDDYIYASGLSSWKYKTSLATGDYIDFTPEEQMMDSNQAQMALHAQVSTGFFSYFILDDSALDGLLYMDVYMDMREVWSAEDSVIPESALVYREITGEDGNVVNVPVAVDLYALGLGDDCAFNAPGAYLVFVDVQPDHEEIKMFLEYVGNHPGVETD